MLATMLNKLPGALRKILCSTRRSTAGETLAETLAAVLVATFAALVLLGSVGVAANLNTRAEMNDKALAADQIAVETRDAGAMGTAPGEAVIVADDGTTLGSYEVDVYIGDEGKYKAYGKRDA